MSKGKLLSNRSGMNGAIQDPHCLVTPDYVESDDACCAALAAAISAFSDQVSSLTEAIEGMGNGGTPVSFPPTVIVRNVCLADGTAQLAYDIIPAGVTDSADITTIYRPYPTEEGECACLL